MKGLDWARLYDDFSPRTLDLAALHAEMSRLMRDSDVQRPAGIIPYVLTRDERVEKVKSIFGIK